MRRERGAVVQPRRDPSRPACARARERAPTRERERRSPAAPQSPTSYRHPLGESVRPGAGIGAGRDRGGGNGGGRGGAEAGSGDAKECGEVGKGTEETER